MEAQLEPDGLQRSLGWSLIQPRSCGGMSGLSFDLTGTMHPHEPFDMPR
jgi:hypothetical protein